MFKGAGLMDNRIHEKGSYDEPLWAVVIGIMLVLGLAAAFVAG
jgi:hypothetical protein